MNHCTCIENGVNGGGGGGESTCLQVSIIDIILFETFFCFLPSSLKEMDIAVAIESSVYSSAINYCTMHACMH